LGGLQVFYHFRNSVLWLRVSDTSSYVTEEVPFLSEGFQAFQSMDGKESWSEENNVGVII
jgi:hypothetical protein